MAEETKVTPEETPKTPSIDDLIKQVESLTETLNKQKKAIDNASSDASAWKKKYYDTLDEAKLAEAKRADAEAATQKELAELKRERAVSKGMAKYVALGYPEELAQMSAEALYDGDFEKVMDLQKSFVTEFESKVKAKLLGEQPKPTPGKTPSGDEIEDPRLTAFKKGLLGV